MAGVWVDAIRSLQYFTVSTAQFRTAVLLRLGTPLPQLSSIHKCIPRCGKEVDAEGYHTLTCKFGVDLFSDMTMS